MQLSLKNLGQNRLNFLKCTHRFRGKAHISPLATHANTKTDGFQFVRVKSDWRQVILFVDDITDTGFTTDRRTRIQQILNIAVNSSGGYLKFFRRLFCRNCKLAPPKKMNYFKKPVRPSHNVDPLILANNSVLHHF